MQQISQENIGGISHSDLISNIFYAIGVNNRVSLERPLIEPATSTAEVVKSHRKLYIGKLMKIVNNKKSTAECCEM